MLVQLGQVTQRTLHKHEKEAREAGKASFFLAWVSKTDISSFSGSPTADPQANRWTDRQIGGRAGRRADSQKVEIVTKSQKIELWESRNRPPHLRFKFGEPCQPLSPACQKAKMASKHSAREPRFA